MIQALSSALAGLMPPALLHLGPVGGVVLGLVLGALAGAVYFGALWWNTRIYLEGGRAWLGFLLQLVRFLLLVVVLVVLAVIGPWPLLAGALGLLVARTLVVRRMRRDLQKETGGSGMGTAA